MASERNSAVARSEPELVGDSIRLTSSLGAVASVSMLAAFVTLALASYFDRPSMLVVGAFAAIVAAGGFVGQSLIPRNATFGVLVTSFTAMSSATAVALLRPDLAPAALLGAVAVVVFSLPLGGGVARGVSLGSGIAAGVLAIGLMTRTALHNGLPTLDVVFAGAITMATFGVTVYVAVDVRAVMLRRERQVAQLRKEDAVQAAQLVLTSRNATDRAAILDQIHHDLAPPVRAISSMVAGHAMWDDPRWERAHGNAMRHIVARLDDLESLQDVAKNEWRAGAEMFSIREAVEAVSDVAAAHAITIHVEAPDLLIFSDRARLEQVLLNLLENGVRHARTRVDVAATLLEDTLAVVVKDDGLGLPKDFAELVLTGVQGDLPGRGGLGLAFVKETVRAHGGALAAISHGHGAEFRFTWRIEMTDVLIVDDDPLWHNLTRELLADHGLTSVVASNLSEAARHWARVAMIDLALGQDDGRGAPQLLTMPCYVHSGSPDEDLPPGFAGRLNKPIEARDIAVLRFAAVSPALAHPPQP